MIIEISGGSCYITAMRILALEAYYSGSHKAFLDGWSARSRHKFHTLTLAGYKWKWRMRHSAITFAEQVNELAGQAEKFDCVFCSDMVNLAEFLGLADEKIRSLPAIAYFHENQLAYPVRVESERDYQFVMTNMTTALAANEVWFNSDFNRQSFLGGLEEFLKRMPDCQPIEAIEKILAKSKVYPPGVDEIDGRVERHNGPLRILWACRWEHDKGPGDFFEAVAKLKKAGGDFRLGVIGERFRDCPEVFIQAKKDFAENIDIWGYQESRADYEAALGWADVIVSTAHHEFFGISVIEAVIAGARPILPKRLSYPEIMGPGEEFFYDGTINDLAEQLIELCELKKAGDIWSGDSEKARNMALRFGWSKTAARLDDAIENVLV